ncbi:unnamed protein product [Sympodiomycopsis kandeliae]
MIASSNGLDLIVLLYGNSSSCRAQRLEGDFEDRSRVGAGRRQSGQARPMDGRHKVTRTALSSSDGRKDDFGVNCTFWQAVAYCRPSFSSKMPRKSATQITQAVSRMLEAGYLKSVPTFYPVLLNNPPTPLPPRSPYPRTLEDVPQSIAKQSLASEQRAQGLLQDEGASSRKKMRSRIPSLNPKPIVYLEDTIRKQFYMDHPWEGFKPRQIVEQEKVEKPKEAPEDVTDLVWWSTNPQPEDVISFTIHLHKHHSMSLSAAYFQALSQYHSLKAEREVSARFAVLEANAWGADFSQGKPNASYEERFGHVPGKDKPYLMRAYNKEEAALDTWDDASQSANPASSDIGVKKGQDGKVRRRAVYLGDFTGGDSYQRGAQAVRVGRVEAFASSRRRDAQTSPQGVPGSTSSSSIGLLGSQAPSEAQAKQRAEMEQFAVRISQRASTSS